MFYRSKSSHTLGSEKGTDIEEPFLSGSRAVSPERVGGLGRLQALIQGRNRPKSLKGRERGSR
jgi:hypothetical protein